MKVKKLLRCDFSHLQGGRIDEGYDRGDAETENESPNIAELHSRLLIQTDETVLNDGHQLHEERVLVVIVVVVRIVGHQLLNRQYVGRGREG